MRLRALRRLEEIEIKQEREKLVAEQKDLRSLLKDEERQWRTIAAEIAELKKRFGPATILGKRRTELGEAPSAVVIPLEAVVEREPVTIVCSDKGWIRAMKGHVPDSDDIKYKEGDRGRFFLHAETTDKLLVFGTNGRFYTIGVDKLPGGRGHGEPIRLMIELGNDQDIVALLVHKPGRKLVIASHDGRGFVVPEEEVVAQTRAGKQVLNLAEGVEAQACAPIEGDHVAVIGENRKMIIFPVAELPEMTRGRGVILQKYKDGGLSDVKTFNIAEGLTWRLGDKTRTETALKDWVGQRAQAGRLPPRGFPASNKFD
jgi:topoisomerase-4 subunit A